MVNDGVARFSPMANGLASRNANEVTAEQALFQAGNLGARLQALHVSDGLFKAPCLARVQQLDVALSHEQETKVQLNHLHEASDQALELVLPKASERGQFATLRYIVDEMGDLHITEKYVNSSQATNNLSFHQVVSDLSGVEALSPVWRPPVKKLPTPAKANTEALNSALSQITSGPQALPKPVSNADLQTVLIGLVMQMASHQKRESGIQVADLNKLLGSESCFVAGVDDKAANHRTENHGTENHKTLKHKTQPSSEQLGWRQPVRTIKGWFNRIFGRGAVTAGDIDRAASVESLLTDRFSNTHLRANLLLANEAFQALDREQSVRLRSSDKDEKMAHADFAAVFREWPGAQTAVQTALTKLDAVGVTARLALLAAETQPDQNESENVNVFEIRVRGKLATALSVLRTQNKEVSALKSLEYDALVVSLAEKVVEKYYPQRAQLSSNI